MGVRVNVRFVSLNVVLVALLACAVFAACESEEPVPYELEVSFSPQQPVPGYATRVLVQVLDLQGENVEGADEVTFTPDGGEALTLTETTEPGQYAYEGWVIGVAGETTWRADVLAAKGRASTEGELSSTCLDTGITGSPCCVDTDCQTGFICGYGACRVIPAAADNGCYADDQCASGICFQCTPEAGGCPDGFACELAETSGVPVCVRADPAVTLGGICASGPACDDYRKNGKETDLDCGGGTCAACADGMECFAHTDCEAGYCHQGICGMPATALGGEGDVTWTTLTTGGDLMTATDVSFNHVASTQPELWVTSYLNDAFIVIQNPGTPQQSQYTIFDKSLHFLDRTMGIAFGPTENFGTCGDSMNEDIAGAFTPPEFMGPVLWPTDESLILSHTGNLAAVHLDMLHSSPQCMGIAAVEGHQFFVFNGHNKVLDWYDFKEPHVPGGEDHSDGQKRRYSDVVLTREPGVPSNMVYDDEDGLIYLADTGTSRVLKVNTNGSVGAGYIDTWFQDGVFTEYIGSTVDEVVGADVLTKPSGLALHEGILYVSDHATGIVFAFDKEGFELGRKDTGLGAGVVGGITIGPDGLLYLATMTQNKVLRLEL